MTETEITDAVGVAANIALIQLRKELRLTFRGDADPRQMAEIEREIYHLRPIVVKARSAARLALATQPISKL